MVSILNTFSSTVFIFIFKLFFYFYCNPNKFFFPRNNYFLLFTMTTVIKYSVLFQHEHRKTKNRSFMLCCLCTSLYIRIWRTLRNLIHNLVHKQDIYTYLLHKLGDILVQILVVYLRCSRSSLDKVLFNQLTLINLSSNFAMVKDGKRYRKLEMINPIRSVIKCVRAFD